MKILLSLHEKVSACTREHFQDVKIEEDTFNHNFSTKLNILNLIATHVRDTWDWFVQEISQESFTSLMNPADSSRQKHSHSITLITKTEREKEREA